MSDSDPTGPTVIPSSTRLGLDQALYAPAGGAVPLLVGDLVVGGLAVSGLASEDEHRLALDALRRHCH